ncbi:hypothetical protein QYE76_005843 [Lolium multiflorum]|uniref:Retrotransposon gag domain-containing protein n=1 Tax=Lolium multiflorum TaxID=4521 RepID=A0AAD8RTJ3_LOLMU|nr:hypothetical protein QYE76_005843 [Lolium multiflorum]
MKKAAELLKKKDEEIDINYVRKLVSNNAKNRKQARRSNPDKYLSKKEAINKVMIERDRVSRRRKVEIIQIQSRYHRIQLRKIRQRERMRCTLAGTSTVFHHRHPGLRVLRYLLEVAVPPETPGPMGRGINIRDNMPPPRDRAGAYAGTTQAGIKTATPSLVGIKNATLSLAEAKDAIRNQGEAGTKSAHLSHAGAGTTEATTTKVKGATEAGASRGSHVVSPKAEDHLTGPLADLPHHHQVAAEVEAEAEAGDPVPARNHPAVPPATPGIASTRNLKHYDGSERPDTWIEDYYNAVTFAGGTPNIACRMLQLYLIGPARVWLSDLEENTIFCWLDLKKAFENHFRGTYKRPATTSDLQACIQKKGETSRSFLTRWLATRNECENVDNRTAMHAFIGGLQRGGLLRHKLTCLVNANKLTLDEMINIASDHTAADDDAGGDLAATAIPLHQQKKNRDNGVSNSNKRKNPLKTRRAEDPTW